MVNISNNYKSTYDIIEFKVVRSYESWFKLITKYVSIIGTLITIWFLRVVLFNIICKSSYQTQKINVQ